MTSRRFAAFFAVAILTILVAVPAAHAQSTVGTITQLQGTANIQRSGATIAAASNMPILLHDKISTDANSTLTIGLVDNSSLQLGASSTLTIDSSVLVNGVGAPSRVGLLGGRLHSIIVGAMRGSSTSFEVNTPNSIGAVRGTTWDTGFDQDPHNGTPLCRKRTTLDVDEGTVEFCTTATPPVCKDVSQGKHSEIRCGAFWLGNAPGLGAVGTLGAAALGVGVAGGIGVGIAAGTGSFSSSSSPPPSSPAK